MNVRHSAGIAAPCECAVSEAYFKRVAVEENGPELRHLLTLGDRIGCNESNFCLRLPEGLSGFNKPCGHIVERASTPAELGYAAHLRSLLVALVLRSSEGRIAENVGAFPWSDQTCPVHL